MLISNVNPSGKLTITHSDAGLTVRCMGHLMCDCGTPVQASDVTLITGPVSDCCNLEDDDEDFDIVTGIRLVCSGCHKDLMRAE
jgi:hypothetical protein